ncbi:MAG: radical SAM protein [bacterium]|nr:radical SAM protein [bacterium]
MLIKTKNSTYVYQKELGFLFNREVINDLLGDAPNLLPHREEFIKYLRRDIPDAEIRNTLWECRSLVIGITEQCNFRCKYCTYSGDYDGQRSHAGKRLSPGTGQKAVDFFLTEIVKHNPRNSRDRGIHIGFYGGESLLEFQLVKDLFLYSRDRIRELGLQDTFDFKYLLTTNGYLMGDMEIIDFLARNGIRIDVSLDGPKSQHDRFRVTVGGKETWEVIVANLNTIKQKYPGYFKENVRVQVTLHPHHDGGAIDAFFRKGELIDEANVSINTLNSLYLKKEKVREMREKPGHPCQLRLQRELEELEMMLGWEAPAATSKLTGNCFPGAAKLFVDTEGQLAVCEKANENLLKLGDVHNGFSFDNIRALIRAYNEEVIANACWDCQILHACPICFANSCGEGGGVNFQCGPIKSGFKEILEALVTKMEKDDDETYTDNPADFDSFMAGL